MNEIIRGYGFQVEAATIQRGDTSTRRIRGVASVTYNGEPGTEYALTEGIVERIAPGAFDHLLNDDVIACVDHDGKMIVGRNGANLKLWTSPRGLEYEIDLPNTTVARDLWENVQSGIIRGSSFKASLKMNDKASVEWSRSGDKDILTIKRFDRLKDISPVSDPAYKGTTSEAVTRSLQDHRAWIETQKRLEILKNINGKG